MAGSPDDIRKLRRQKLLQFSEQRMKRILHSDAGPYSYETSEDPSGLLINDGRNNTNSREEDSGPNTAANSSARSQPSPMEATNSSSTQDSLSTEATADTDKSHIRKRVKTNDAFAESKFPGITTSTPSPSPSPSPRRSPLSSGNRASGHACNKVTLSLLQFDLVRLISCVVLALLTRKILNTAWSLFFAESILVPFTLLQLGIYTFLPKFCKAVVLPERGSMIATCLIVCGVDQSTVVTFHKVVGYSASIAEDVAIYIFSFVLADFLVG